MQQSNFTTEIIVDRSPREVYSAINNVRGWWSEEIEGNTDKVGEEWYYHYQDVHRCRIKIMEMIPDKKVTWQVLDNYFSFTTNKDEWKDNKIIFEITQRGDNTHLQFTQLGLVPEYECYDICQDAWNTYVQKSLYSMLTTGVGQPNGKEKPQTEHEKNLAVPNFTTTFFVNQPPQKVYESINNVRGWWQGEIKGEAEKLNDEFTYQVKDIHYSKQKLVELDPDKKVVWLVTDSNLDSFTDKQEWTDTKIIFEVNEINNKTQVRFTHVGLTPQLECYGSCSNAWEHLIQKSLVSLITTGKGTNVFGE